MTEQSDERKELINQHMLVAQNLRASHKILFQIERSKANTETMVDLLPDYYFVINQSGRILKGNISGAKLLKTNTDGIINQNVVQLFSTESSNIFFNKINKLTDAYRRTRSNRSENKTVTSSFELPIDSEDYEPKSIHWNLRIFEGVSLRRGALISIFGRDITEIRKYEQQLSEIFSAIPLGIMMIDSRGDVNGPYSAYLEFLLEQDTLKDKNIYEVLFDRAHQNMTTEERKGYREFQNVFGADEIFYKVDKKRFPKILKLPLKNGFRWLEVTYHPIIKDEMINKVLLVFSDISRLMKEREKAGVQSEDELSYHEKQGIIKRR
ncbi:MAG: PAS domain-containing protein [Oligoflexales bacterium]|nr:PAS domain-containing protein [Oligoflexales bacterium]